MCDLKRYVSFDTSSWQEGTEMIFELELHDDMKHDATHSLQGVPLWTAHETKKYNFLLKR